MSSRHCLSLRCAVGLVLLVMTLFCLCMMVYLGHLDMSRPRFAMLNRAQADVNLTQRGTDRNIQARQTLSQANVLPYARTVSPGKTLSLSETMVSFQGNMETVSQSGEYDEEGGQGDGEEGRHWMNLTEPSDVPARRLVVVVLAQMRTGSSFTGQLFNQHPSFFYMFEPLWHLRHLKTVTSRSIPVVNGLATQRPHSAVSRTEAALGKVLGEILQCDFGEFTKFLGNAGLFGIGKALKQFCDEVLHLLPEKCPFILQPQTLPNFVDYCKRTPYMAVKTIRIQNMDSLEHLLQDPTLDLKMIHLVRDPRATITSRLSLKDKRIMDKRLRTKLPFTSRLLIEKDIHKLCSWITRCTVTQNVPSPWRGRYVMVRYEDLAEHPELMTKKLYEFLGVPLDDTVLHWVRENTQGDGIWHNHYSTKNHDANATTKRWRFRLSYSAVSRVQGICRDAMKMVGYKEVDSSKTLTDLQTSLVGKIPENVIAVRP